jgi:hypothetical protein
MASSKDTRLAALDTLASYVQDEGKAVSVAWLARDQGLRAAEAAAYVQWRQLWLLVGP